MPRIVALVAALVFVVSASSMVVAAGSDLNIVFDASRARVHQAGGGALADGGGRPASDVATAFMQRHGRDDNTIATLRVDAMYIDHGITHLTFHQEVGGLQIAGAYAKAALNARGDLIHLIDNLVDVTGSAAPAQIDATQALAAAIATNLPTIGDRPGILHRSGSTATFQKTAAFRASPTAEQVLLARESGRLEKAFLVTTWTRQGNLLQRSLVDGSGVVAATELRTAYDSYRVYPEDPSKGLQVVAPGPGSSSPYSPDGWLSGSQTTINIGGNNVHAYLDRDANNAADAGGSAVTDGNFLAVSDLATAPSTTGNQAVAVQSLFYLNNLLHDTLYAHGFTEATGNFQENNFGNGGSGSDSVNAEAQDGSGTDNANFATPADGQNPTMQMYLWTGPGGTHEVATGAGSYEAYGAAFGPALTTTGRTAPLSEVNDGTSPTTDACEALPRKSLTGKIAIVDRGVCTFTTKIKNAQAAGAVGVIVVNNAAGPAFTMGGSGSFRISAVMVAQADGALVRGQVPGSGTIRLKAIQPLQIDGDIDSDIVYHEYGHGLTWRMIGSMSGPMSGAIGEGASDVLAMLLNGNDVIGEYAFGDPKGIRSAPYGTLAKTYADVTGAEVHDDGEVLGAIGWSLIERYGSAGKTSTGLLDTWVQGFKYTPAGPKFEDMRDGMLAAAAALGRTDEHCLIWMAFAEFGVGVGASATVSRRGVITVTESFALPPECP